MPAAPAPSRVVITGCGWVTPLGCRVDDVWRRLVAGDSAFGPVTRFPASSFATNFAAEVRDFRLQDFLPAPGRHASAPIATQFSLAAAAQAWEQSGLASWKKLVPRRFGAYLGSGEGTMDFENFVATNLAAWNAEARSIDYRRWAAGALRTLSPERELEQQPNLPGAHLADVFGCRGPAFNCMTACAASTQAIGEAYKLLQRGDADVMFAGGSHSMIHALGMTGFIRLTAMSRRRDDPNSAARPFDLTRDGFVMGEGAGMLILERLDHAQARGATPLAEICGFGSSADAYRITDIQPEGKGAAAAMLQSLTEAGIDPSATGADGRPHVHYISAHGTGTKENDSIETLAVKSVFGPLASRIPFSSVKSMMGHLIQAAGAVELITCIQAIRTGIVPPTINLRTPDPQCDLDYVPNTARDLNPVGGVETCMSNSFGFGGQNDTIVVRRFRP